jgi:hypothetical protein
MPYTPQRLLFKFAEPDDIVAFMNALMDTSPLPGCWFGEGLHHANDCRMDLFYKDTLPTYVIVDRYKAQDLGWIKLMARRHGGRLIRSE